MWVPIAALAFLLFYLLVIRWYLPTMWDVPSWDRPLAYRTRWLHAAVWLIGIFLFVASVVAICMVSGWLFFVPFILLFALTARQRFKKESQIDATIKKAIVLHYELTQQGMPEPDVYKQIAKQLTNISEDELSHHFDSPHEWTLERLVQYLILPLNDLWHFDMGAGATGVVAADNFAMANRIKAFRQSFEGLRAAHEERDRRELEGQQSPRAAPTPLREDAPRMQVPSSKELVKTSPEEWRSVIAAARHDSTRSSKQS